MFWNFGLLIFVIMLAVFILLLLAAKLPTGLSLMAAAIAGYITYLIVARQPFELRILVEGMFGYFDTILVITTAMIFMGALEASGALEYISAVLVKALGRFPSLLLVAFMLIIMFPAMVTGSSLASAITAGALVAPMMIRWGIPKAKTGAIIAAGSVLGMVAPPVNVPAMVICEVVDIPYTAFELPLLLLAVPLAIVTVLMLGRKYVKPLKKEDVPLVVDTAVLKKYNFTVVIPFLVLVAFIILEMIFPRIFGTFGMPAMFVASSVFAFFLGNRHPFIKVHAKGEPYDENKPDSVFAIVSRSVEKSFSAMGLLMGVGMFMEVISINSVRGWIIDIAICLPNVWQYVGVAISLPLFGGITAFGSASMLGGPFVMAFKGICDSIMMTSGLSLLAALGEYSPPTAMSANVAADIVGEKRWTKITKAALPAIAVMFAYTLIYLFVLAPYVTKLQADKTTASLCIMLAVAVAAALIFAAVLELLVRKVKFFGKHAHTVTAETAETVERAETAVTEETEADKED